MKMINIDKINIAKLYLKANKSMISSLVILAILAVIFSQFVLPSSSGACTQTQPTCGTPQLTIDKKMKNLTNQDSAWSDSVVASPDQKLAVQIIIKNIGTATANNVFVRDVLPEKLGYISGSTKIDGSAVSDGITSGGINIGSLAVNASKIIYFEINISGTFVTGLTTLTNTAFARADGLNEINDTANVVICNSQTQTKDLTISKTARNITAGQNNFSESINAFGNDRIAFQIQIQNTGNLALSNVFVRDVLPSYVSYIGGTTRVGSQIVSDGITGSGINIGSLAKDGAVTITFEASIDYSGSDNLNLTNTAFARADQVSEKSDTAQILVIDPNLSIAKTVRDITKGQISYLDSIQASNSDLLDFQIQIQNTGAVNLTNVFVRDNLPSGFNYVSGSTRVDGSSVSDGIVSGGINVGSLGVGAIRTITFEATVNVSGSGTQTLSNVAYARADQVNEKSDSASVVVTVIQSIFNLSITKAVRNETGGGGFSDSVNANNSEQLMFQIQVQNTSNVTLNNILVRDNLPSGLSYSSGSTRVDGSSVSDGIVSGGINVGSLNQGNIRTITFEVTVNSGFSNQTLTNTAFARADQVNEKSDTATVFVSGTSGTFNFTITKTVRDETAGQYSYFDAINANNGDQLMFRVQIQNNSNNTLNNLYVRDVLPSGLNYISGSTKIDGSFVSDSIVSGGINSGSLAVNGIRTITFETSVNVFGSYNSQTLTNTAYARADQVSEKSDTATAYVSQQNIYGNLNIVKYVRNQTSGQISWTTSANASSGDRVTFTIQISTLNSNQQVNNVRVWDSLPSGLTFVSGTARLDGVFVSDALVSNGINLGTLVGNQTRTVTFDAIVNPTLSNQTLTNVSYVTGDNVPQQSASARVIIGQVTSLNSTATLSKKVANLTSPNGSDTDNAASIGNTLQYTITLTNNGPGVMNNIRISDALPPYTTFQAADSNGSYDSSANQVTWTNGNLSNGASLSFSYRVIVQSVPNNGYVIRNTASASADNLGTINSNEVTTTVGGIAKGAVKAVTGSDNLQRNFALAIVISLWGIFILYLLIEYGNFWKGARLKLAILKLKLKGKLSELT
jgi:uncharacterized repeat protein (TIGR01451 family)